MTEEELFCKLFPDYAVNGKPLSPYFDLFESGYEQAENRIEDLEETINKLREQLSLRYNLEDKITELKLKLEALEGQTPWKDIKDKSEVIGKLTKVKELLKLMLKEFERLDVLCNYQLRTGAEQFLKGDGCPDCFCEDCTKDCETKKLGLVEVKK